MPLHKYGLIIFGAARSKVKKNHIKNIFMTSEQIESLIDELVLFKTNQQLLLELIKKLATDAQMALDEDWDKSDEGFMQQLVLIDETLKQTKLTLPNY